MSDLAHSQECQKWELAKFVALSFNRTVAQPLSTPEKRPNLSAKPALKDNVALPGAPKKKSARKFPDALHSLN